MARFLVISLLLGVWSIAAAASPSPSLTYHGRLLRSDNTPVTDPSVQFRVRIYSPGAEACLFFDETYTRDMTSSQGVFSIRIGADTPSSANTEPFGLERVFQNRSTFTFGGGKCAIGASYVPSAGAGRKIQVSFNDGSGWEDLPEQSIAQVPQAIESLSVGGYAGSELFRVHDGAGAPVSLTPWTQANYAKLESIVAGTDGTYLKTETDPTVPASLKDGVDWSEIASGPGQYFTYRPNDVACATGQVLKWTAANRWECGSDDGGAAPVDATTAAKGLVELATNGENAANVVVQGNDSRLSDARPPNGSAGGDLGGTYPAPNVVALRGTAISAGAPSDGQFLKYVSAGTNWMPATLAISDVAGLGTQLGNKLDQSNMPASCGAHQTLNFSSPTGAWSCVGIGGLDASAVSGGAFDVARIPTGTSGSTVAIGNDARFPASTCGSGNKMRWDGAAWQCEADATGTSGEDWVFSTKTADFTVTAADDRTLFLMNGALTAELPTAAAAGANFKVKFVNASSSTGTIDLTGGNTLNGNATSALKLLERHSVIELVSDGTNWYTSSHAGAVSLTPIYEFTSHTFTSCGTEGPTGPSQASCRTAYSTTWDENDMYYTVSGGIQKWLIPENGKYRITVAGAEGGNVVGGAYNPGKGAVLSAEFSLTQDMWLNIVVGQQPASGKWGGGGGTFVWLDSRGRGNAPLIVAGAGGGDSNNGSGGASGLNGEFGESGTLNGGVSGAGGTATYGDTGGGMGWSSSGTSAYGADYAGNSTTFSGAILGGVGGVPGGFGGGGGCSSGYGIGGGGGGYSGGGAGTSGSRLGGGGGGSYVNGMATHRNNLGQDNTGHGYVIIERIP